MYDRWPKEYGGLKTHQAKRLKHAEREDVRLKRLPADAELGEVLSNKRHRGSSSP
jgi:hypothetical protein